MQRAGRRCFGFGLSPLSNMTIRLVVDRRREHPPSHLAVHPAHLVTSLTRCTPGMAGSLKTRQHESGRGTSDSHIHRGSLIAQCLDRDIYVRV